MRYLWIGGRRNNYEITEEVNNMVKKEVIYRTEYDDKENVKEFIKTELEMMHLDVSMPVKVTIKLEEI